MRKIAYLCLLLSGFAAAYSVTTMEECAGLRVYFGLPHEKAGKVIADYEKRLKEEPSDCYADLALGVLYAAVASTLDDPDKSAVGPLIEHTERVLLTDSNQVYALAYNALGHGLRAKYSLNPFEQISEVNISLKEIDRAVSLAMCHDSEPFARLVRGSIYASLPEFFNKWDVAIDDFSRWENIYETNKNVAGEMVLVYYYSGELSYFRGRTGKAREYWRKVAAINTDLGMDFAEARLSQKRLKETEKMEAKGKF